MLRELLKRQWHGPQGNWAELMLLSIPTSLIIALVLGFVLKWITGQ